MLGAYVENVRKNTPLVHNITNYVTVNDVQTFCWRAVEVRSCQMNRRMWKILPPSVVA